VRKRVVCDLRYLKKLVLVDRAGSVLVQLHKAFLETQEFRIGDWRVRGDWVGIDMGPSLVCGKNEDDGVSAVFAANPAVPAAPICASHSQFEFFSRLSMT
jgi:hypothetical protein